MGESAFEAPPPAQEEAHACAFFCRLFPRISTMRLFSFARLRRLEEAKCQHDWQNALLSGKRVKTLNSPGNVKRYCVDNGPVLPHASCESRKTSKGSTAAHEVASWLAGIRPDYEG